MVVRILNNDYLTELQFIDVLKFHGNENQMELGFGYRLVQEGLRAICDYHVPNRQEIQIHTGNTGEGFKDVAECMTRAVSRQKYVISTNLDENEFLIVYRQEAVRVIIHPYLMLQQQEKSNIELQEMLCYKALNMPISDLFTIEKVALSQLAESVK